MPVVVQVGIGGEILVDAFARAFLVLEEHDLDVDLFLLGRTAQRQVEQDVPDLAEGAGVAKGLAVADDAARGVDLGEGGVLVVGIVGEAVVGDRTAVVDGVAGGVFRFAERERGKRRDVGQCTLDSGLPAREHALQN